MFLEGRFCQVETGRNRMGRSPRYGLSHTRSYGGKKRILDEFLEQARPISVRDLGVNTGLYSHLASRRAIQAVAHDMDPAEVEQGYLRCLREG